MNEQREVIRNADGKIPMREETIEMPSTPGQEQVQVYDLDGKRHMMPRLNAHDMVQHLGWFYKLPKGPGVAAERQVIVLVGKKNAPAPEAGDAGKEQVDLTAMSVDELRAFAKSEFDMEFGPEVEAKHILDAIIAEQDAA